MTLTLKEIRANYVTRSVASSFYFSRSRHLASLQSVLMGNREAYVSFNFFGFVVVVEKRSSMDKPN